MTTILDVARLADVSIATVSRVINDDPAVRPRTRRLVEAAIEQLDYRPNAAARSLRLSRSQTLGLVVTDLANSIFIRVVHGIESVARDHGYSLFLCDTANDPDAENMHLERLYERRVDGVILYAIGRTPPALSRFRAAKSPVVAMGPAAFCRGLPGVLVSERGATIAAMRRVMGFGHRRIACINYGTPPGRYAYRTRAIRRELSAEDGPGWNPELLVNVNTVEECHDRLATLLGQPNRPTALVVLTTPFIPHVLQSVYEAGLRVPEDVSVLIYGDSPWAAAHRPPLSAIAVDYYEWGRETAELLLSQIEAPNEPPPRITRESQFIERASLAPPPTND